MPFVDWNEVKDPEERTFEPLPDGEYLVAVSDVYVTAATPQKAERWGLKLEVCEGEYEGRVIFDNLYWGPAHTVKGKQSLQRCKLVCHRLGLEVAGQKTVEPGHLVGKKAYVKTYVDEYDGKKSNKVGFGDWRAVPPPIPDDEAPF